MEIYAKGLWFTSNFDSGNLARVEKVCKEDMKESGNHYTSMPDYEFNVWTKPDCHGTIFENGNRSWFFFGVKGGIPGKLIKINIMNLNRQGKLYSQGYGPLVRTLPVRPKWERVRDKPSFETVDGQFVLSFVHRFLELRGTTTYFAFAYPYTYSECQQKLSALDRKFSLCKTPSQCLSKDKIYYYREVLCYSLGNLRVDLITVSSHHGISDEEEPRFDPNLFPERTVPRCKKFTGKRVFILTSRVHPGETPGSFVFNGFLNFILHEQDLRAKELRKQYVFKLIPMLNPDGVFRGHYRTDTRGVNLNRVYADPSFALHPAVYASKSIIVYHHVHNRIKTSKDEKDIIINFPTVPWNIQQHYVNDSKANSSYTLHQHNGEKHFPASSVNADPNFQCAKFDVNSPSLFITQDGPQKENHLHKLKDFHFSAIDSNIYKQKLKSPVKVEPLNLAGLNHSENSDTDGVVSKDLAENNFSSSSSSINSIYGYQPESQPRKVDSELMLHLSALHVSEDVSSQQQSQDFISDNDRMDAGATVGNEGSDNEGDFTPELTNTNSVHLNDLEFHKILPQHSGVAFYVDLHGHASRRGCFIYGNYFENENMQIENMVFPKMVSLNTSNFEFTGCNFSERNMYARDKRDGMSKEGSGRVSIYKAIGIIHSYTLECNYNTGRVMNSVTAAHGDNGRATPPSFIGLPPKYTPAQYEDVGKALAIASLDMIDSNPWSRLTLSEYKSVHGVREWLRRHALGRNCPKGTKNFTKSVTHSNSSIQFSTGPARLNLSRHGYTDGNSNAISLNLSRLNSNQYQSSLHGKRELRPIKEGPRCAIMQTKRHALPLNMGAKKDFSKISSQSVMKSVLPLTSVLEAPQSDNTQQVKAGILPKKIRMGTPHRLDRIAQVKSAPQVSLKWKTSNKLAAQNSKPLRAMVPHMVELCPQTLINSKCPFDRFSKSAENQFQKRNFVEPFSLEKNEESLIFNDKLKKKFVSAVDLQRGYPPKKRRKFIFLKKRQGFYLIKPGITSSKVEIKDDGLENNENKRQSQLREKPHSKPLLPSLSSAAVTAAKVAAGEGPAVAQDGSRQDILVDFSPRNSAISSLGNQESCTQVKVETGLQMLK